MSNVILHAEGLNKSFGAVTAAANINVEVQEGSVLGLIGTNGAGKTTFVNMITGYLKPDSGRVILVAETLRNWPLVKLPSWAFAALSKSLSSTTP